MVTDHSSGEFTLFRPDEFLGPAKREPGLRRTPLARKLNRRSADSLQLNGKARDVRFQSREKFKPCSGRRKRPLNQLTSNNLSGTGKLGTVKQTDRNCWVSSASLTQGNSKAATSARNRRKTAVRLAFKKSQLHPETTL